MYLCSKNQKTINMEKKFKDLKIGDFIYIFKKMEPTDGFVKMTLDSDFNFYDLGNSYVADASGDEFYSRISIPKKDYSRSSSSSRYYVYATSERELQSASRKYLETELHGRLYPALNEAKEMVTNIERKVSIVEELLNKKFD